MLNRLNKELTDLMANPPENCSICLEGDDLYRWRLSLRGPPETPYRGGRFEILLEIPETYPFKPPEARFLTMIYHPNVKTESGEICSQIYQSDWVPSLNIRFIAETILSMLITPIPEHAVEDSIAAELLQNPAAYEHTASEWVTRYARN